MTFPKSVVQAWERKKRWALCRSGALHADKTVALDVTKLLWGVRKRGCVFSRGLIRACTGGQPACGISGWPRMKWGMWDISHRPLYTI